MDEWVSGFLYIASVSVIPELLAESRSGKQALKEYAAMAFGVFCMVCCFHHGIT